MDNFDDMNLREELLRGIYAYGFEKPSAIQQRAIIPCIKGNIIKDFFFFLFTNFIVKYIKDFRIKVLMPIENMTFILMI